MSFLDDLKEGVARLKRGNRRGIYLYWDDVDRLMEIASIAERQWHPSLKVYYCAVCRVISEVGKPTRHNNNACLFVREPK